VPDILQFLVAFQGLFTRAEVEHQVFTKYFAFLVVNIFLVSLFTGSLFGHLEQYIRYPADIITLLATALPKQSNFFINYVLVQSFLTFSLLLWRPLDITKQFLKKYLAKSKRDFREVELAKPCSYHSLLAQHILIFVIVSTFSTMSPLILPFGFCYFLLAYITLKYNIMYVYEHSYEAGGVMWPLIFDRMMFGLVLYQLTLIGVFSIYNFPAGPSLAGATLIFTVLFWIWIHYRFDKQSKYGALEDWINEGSLPKDFDLTCYNHPALSEIEEPEPQGSKEQNQLRSQGSVNNEEEASETLSILSVMESKNLSQY